MCVCGSPGSGFAGGLQLCRDVDKVRQDIHIPMNVLENRVRLNEENNNVFCNSLATEKGIKFSQSLRKKLNRV